ncbi:Y+L amino acid transporter 2-like [Daphnia carinata]|uniref:Y+L amino acid transporter 2-like n=1 Tax=Daphnia carinata TaxID=120202 RepID=UPI00257FA217|nr:Y+L amino acid transporter 2-like [Daphnia carinata]
MSTRCNEEEILPMAGGRDGNGNTEKKIAMERRLGLVDGIAMIVGSIVGSGIFISPKGVLQSTGSAGLSIIVWASCGFISFVGAICYAELGTMINSSGGDYAYLGEAYGPLPAFLYLWAALLIIIPVSNAIIALAFANYILQPIWGACSPSDSAVRLVAAFAVGVLAYINCCNMRWVAKLQTIFMAAKVIALGLVISTGCIAYFIQGESRGFRKPFENTTTDPSLIALSFYSGLFSFAGWNCLNFVAEEVREPHKNLPRAIFISMPIITIVYVMTNVAYLIVLTPEEILNSSAVAVTFGDHVYSSFTWVIQVLVAISALGTLHSSIFSSSRIFFVGARNGHLPGAIALISIDNLTPIPSILFMGGLTMIMLVVTDVYVLINYTSFVEATFVAAAVGGLLWLRRKRPDVPRPIKVNLVYPIAFFVVSIFLVCFPVFSSPMEVVTAIGIIVTAIPVFYLCIARKSKPKWISAASNKCTVLCQKIFLAVPESIGEKTL